ncbi:MAG: XRE family transcriptional regulator [Dehalococcoidia bacterium]|nr:XRE family transcriptional regulator [Dehalococcoidia bacterium]
MRDEGKQPKVCLVTGWSKLAERFKERWQDQLQVKSKLAGLVESADCDMFIVDTDVSDMDVWPAPIHSHPQAQSRLWLFLTSKRLNLNPLPPETVIFERELEAVDDLVFFLRERYAPESYRQIEKVDYFQSNRTIVVHMKNGRIYLLRADELPEADSSEIVRWTAGKSRNYFRAKQSSGNWFEVPWDEVLYHCEPEYEHYKGREKAEPPENRALRIGNKVRELRTVKGLSVAELARRTGMKRPNLSRVESGRHEPSLETLERIADALVLPVAELVSRPMVV